MQLNILNDVDSVRQCCDTHDFCYEICREGQDNCDEQFRGCFNQYCEETFADSDTKRFGNDVYLHFRTSREDCQYNGHQRSRLAVQ